MGSLFDVAQKDASLYIKQALLIFRDVRGTLLLHAKARWH